MFVKWKWRSVEAQLIQPPAVDTEVAALLRYIDAYSKGLLFADDTNWDGLATGLGERQIWCSAPEVGTPQHWAGIGKNDFSGL